MRIRPTRGSGDIFSYCSKPRWNGLNNPRRSYSQLAAHAASRVFFHRYDCGNCNYFSSTFQSIFLLLLAACKCRFDRAIKSYGTATNRRIAGVEKSAGAGAESARDTAVVACQAGTGVGEPSWSRLRLGCTLYLEGKSRAKPWLRRTGIQCCCWPEPVSSATAALRT